MEIVAAGRRGGKTTRAMEWLAEDVENRIMVFPSRPMAMTVYRGYANEYGLKAYQFKSMHEMRGLGQNASIGIENLELFQENPFTTLYNVDFVTVDKKWLIKRMMDG